MPISSLRMLRVTWPIGRGPKTTTYLESLTPICLFTIQLLCAVYYARRQKTGTLQDAKTINMPNLNAFCSITSTYVLAKFLMWLLLLHKNNKWIKQRLASQSQTLCFSDCRLSLLVVVTNFTKSVGKLGILYYYRVAEMHIFLSEVDLSRLASRCLLYTSDAADE